MARGGWKSAAAVASAVLLAMGWPAQARAQAGDAWKFQGIVYAYVPDISATTGFPAGGT